MIEFRWVIVLTLWTVLIGPIVDLTQSRPRGQAARGKNVPAARSPAPR